MSEKPKKVAPKRKAETQNDHEAPPAKKQDDGESKLTVMFVKDIPSSVPEFCINQNISSGLVVGFSIQEIANVLFNEFFGNTIHSDTQQQQIEAQIGQWIEGGIELSLTKPNLYIVSDGPPLAMSSAKKPTDARLSNNNNNKNLSVFISKFFAVQDIFPGVAIGVGSEKAEIEAKISQYIEENVDMDHRPNDIIESHPKTGDIIQIDLKEPGFYRLATGAPYKDYCKRS